VLDVGASVNLPGRLVAPSKLDLKLWENVDMLNSMIKQGYNPDANALLIQFFCFEHRHYTVMFAKLVGDCYYREASMCVLTVLLQLLVLPDSHQQYRIETLLHGLLTTLANRKLYNTAGMAAQLLKLFELFETQAKTSTQKGYCCADSLVLFSQ